MELVCYNSNGLEDIKKAMKVEEGVSVHYLGAPRYKVSLTAPDYKTAEKKLDTVLERISEYAQKNNCDFKTDSEK